MNNNFITMNKNRIIGYLPLMAIMLMVSCVGRTEKKNVADEAEKIEVRTNKVHLVNVDQFSTFTGTVQADVTNNIAPQSPGRISKVFVEVGDHVKKGQKLAEMDQANLQQKKLQLDNEELEFKRVDELYKIGGVSKSEWDARKMSYDIAKTAYENLEENTSLTSPIDGMVMQRNYDNGDMYSGGTPLYVVEKINPVKLIINVSEGLYSNIRKGMPVDVALDVYGDEKFRGTVSIVYPSIDPATRTFPVEVTIENGNERIRPGMFARVTINYGVENRIVAPDQAIIKQPGSGERYVFVYNNGKAEYKKVEIGRLIGTGYEVISGLKDGDEVITTGLNRVTNGAEVTIVE